MRHGLLLAAGLTMLLGACLEGAVEDGGGGGDDDGNNNTGSGAGSPTGAGPTDLPCDVAAVVATCTSSHAVNPPVGGLSITSAADLAATSAVDPSMTVAERSLVRMKDGSMPPGAPLSADQIAVFEAWISDGMPTGDCGAGGAPPVQVVCSSNSYWMGGDDESKDMHPGLACIDCHKNPPGGGEHGPGLVFAGTVYPTLHEEDDCNGLGGTLVVVTDSTGRTVQATARSESGNFFIETEDAAPLVMPIRAEVRRGDKVLAMKDPVDSADCNSCHTELGTDGAPGRILAP
jgi:hypothetical protein